MAKPYISNLRALLRDRQKLGVLLVCVVVASFAWLLTSLGKSYNATVVVPVRFINAPVNKTMVNVPPDQIAISVRGSGYDLMQYRENLGEDTLIINLDNLKMAVHGGYQRGYLDAAEVSKSLQERLAGQLTINHILTDSVEFLFDLKVVRSLPVRSRVKFQLADNHVLLDSVRTTPFDLELEGALSVLESSAFVPTRVLDLGVIDHSVQVKVAPDLSGFGQDAKAVADSVTVYIHVDKLTEKRLMITPTKLNVPDSIEMLVFPNTIEVSALVPISLFDAVNESDFLVEVDFNDLERDVRVLPVHLNQWPVEATRVQLRNTQVEAVLTRIDQ